MYEPKIGEWVKIVADTCGHALVRGAVVKIARQRDDRYWYVIGRDVYIGAKDVARLNPSMRKLVKNLEKFVKQSLEEVIGDHPELKATVGRILVDIVNEAN